MKNDTLLTTTSLLAIVLMSLHLTDDIVRGLDPVGPKNLAVAILVVWLVAAVLLTGKRAGYLVLSLGSLMAAGMPVLHLQGRSIGAIIQSPGGYFFLWTLLALGVTGTFALILNVRGLWNLRRQSRPTTTASQ